MVRSVEPGDECLSAADSAAALGPAIFIDAFVRMTPEPLGGPIRGRRPIVDSVIGARKAQTLRRLKRRAESAPLG